MLYDLSRILRLLLVDNKFMRGVLRIVMEFLVSGTITLRRTAKKRSRSLDKFRYVEACGQRRDLLRDLG